MHYTFDSNSGKYKVQTTLPRKYTCKYTEIIETHNIYFKQDLHPTGLSDGAARLLSPTTAWVRIPASACEKVASDLGLGGGFHGVLRFPPLLTTG